MLAERKAPGRPLLPGLLSAALAVGLGLAGIAIGPSVGALAEASTVRLAVVVPIVVPESTTGLIPAVDLDQYTSAQGLLTRQLDAVVGRSVAIAIDPMIITSIRVLGDSAPPAAIAWLARLASTSNEIFPLAWADADVTLETQSGSRSTLAPETFDFAIDPDLFQPRPDPTPTPVPTPVVSTLPDYPTTAGLTAWPYTMSDIAWPRENTVVTDDLRLLATGGFDTALLSSSNLQREPSPGSTATIDGRTVVVSDDEISQALRSAAETFSLEQWEPAITTLQSAIDAARRTRPGDAPTIVATLDRSVPITGSRLTETLDALQRTAAVTLIPFSEAVGEDAPAAAIIDQPQPAVRLSQAGQLIEAESAERPSLSVAADPARITADRRLRLLALLSNSWADSAGWSDAAGSFITESIALRNAVQLVSTSNFLLIADNGQRLPITVSNDLDQRVTVYVTVRPQSGLLAVENTRVELRIDPHAQAKVDVPVRSLSNGVVEIDVTLASATGEPVGAPISAEVNVQAGWETPIVVIIAALVVVVFVVGIVRTVFRRRRAAGE